MNYQADFTEGEVLFTEILHKPPKLDRLQGAMFLDRPDLWPTTRKRREGKPVPKEQQPLFNPE